MSKSSPTEIYQIKITLQRSKPPIWRRIEVPSEYNLAQLHDIVQISMGWEDAHLHQFKVKGERYMPQEMIKRSGVDKNPSEDISLRDAFEGPMSSIEYEYDFGDSWYHDLVLEKILAPESGVFYPRCSGGKMACPLEDCGGLFGYYNMLNILKNPEHPEYGDMLDWADGNVDPEEFSEEEVNEELEYAFG